jgi:histidine ammonia-lyase
VPVILTGRDLTLEQVVRVARGGEGVEIAGEALAAMRAARAVADHVVEAQVAAYGVTTGLGVRKANRVESRGHDVLVLAQHRIAQGPAAPRDVVRATALRLANGLARGTTVASPELALRMAGSLNDDQLPDVRIYGSAGQADLAPLADLALGVVEGVELAPGETIALLNQNAFATGWGALALHDALQLLDALDVAGALDLEALGANHDLLHPAIADARPSPGVAASLQRIGGLVEGSGVAARSLQDPLTFRTLPLVHGAARDAFTFVVGQITLELNAAQANPLVVVEEKRIASVGLFESQSLATALDIARLALAPPLTSAAERGVKLLQAPLTGLPEGLGARAGLAESAMSELGIALQALAAEARLLAQPVSLELVSTTQAEGIEDRTTMAPLAARRLAEMVGLGRRVVALELLLAAQACELRGQALGTGTAAAHATVRSVAPFVAEGDRLPELEPLVELVATGAIT